MENKFLVRIIKNELIDFKNVNYGELRYINYSSVEKEAVLQKNDIVGIYGQNGSGKTALVEALDIADEASERPIQIIIGPVTTGGRNLITLFTPTSLKIKATTRYNRPATTIPPHAYAAFSLAPISA